MNEGMEVDAIYRGTWALLAGMMAKEKPRDLAELVVFACPSAWTVERAPLALASVDEHGWTIAIFEADYLVGVLEHVQKAAPGFVAGVGDLVATLDAIAAPGRARVVVLGGGVCETRSVGVDELRAVVA
jgi:hypothetical protein